MEKKSSQNFQEVPASKTSPKEQMHVRAWTVSMPTCVHDLLCLRFYIFSLGIKLSLISFLLL